jgi:hypothetical protein
VLNCELKNGLNCFAENEDSLTTKEALLKFALYRDASVTLPFTGVLANPAKTNKPTQSNVSIVLSMTSLI